MEQASSLQFTIYGLPLDRKRVNADVFVKKLKVLLLALKTADKTINGSIRHDFLISKLETGSAKVTLEEREFKRPHRNESPIKRSIKKVGSTIHRIHDGSTDGEDIELIKRIAELAKGSGKEFQKAEIICGDDEPLLIDDYLYNQASRMLESATCPDEKAPAFFKGKSIGDFVGKLRLLEDTEQGNYILGQLSIGQSGATIECVIKRSDLPRLRTFFGERVRVYLGFETWCLNPGTLNRAQKEAMDKAVRLARVRPVHSEPKLPLET